MPPSVFGGEPGAAERRMKHVRLQQTGATEMERIEELTDYAVAQLPQLVKPILILVIGWMAVAIIAALVRRLLGKTRLDNLLAERIFPGSNVAVERTAGRVVYVLGLLFVLIAFLESLDLRVVSQPLNEFLNALFVFGPRLLGAVLLLLLAWLVATLVRALSRRALSAFGVDERVGLAVAEPRMQLSHTISETLYWVVFLLFLPAVLDALALEGVLQPLQRMLDVALSALPNIFAAGLIVVVGWFAARIAQRVVTNVLASSGLDRVGEGESAVLQLPRRPSELVGLLVYALILIPVIIAGLNQLGLDAVTRPASVMLQTLLETIPALLGAAIILTIAYFAGKLAANMVAGLLAGIGFDSLPNKLGFSTGQVADNRPSQVAGHVTLLVIMAFALVEALHTLGFDGVAAIIGHLIDFGGHVLLGALILAVGLYLGRIAAQAVRSSQLPQAATLALVTRIAVLVLATAMGLAEMGVAEDIIRLAFGLLLGSLAVAAAISFGLGGREVAGQLLRRWTATPDRPSSASPPPLPPTKTDP